MGIITEQEYRYNMLIKTFASRPEPAFETESEQVEVWGRNWGCNSDVGNLRKVLMHRPGDELKIVDPAKKLPFTFLERLKELKIKTIEVCPDDPVWTINCLAVRPGRILIADQVSPRTLDKLNDANISIRLVPYDKVYLGGGGIHCSTGPLVRDPI